MSTCWHRLTWYNTPVIDLVSCAELTFFTSQIARAASQLTISLLWRNQPSSRSSICFWTLYNKSASIILYVTPSHALWIVLHHFGSISNKHAQSHRILKGCPCSRFSTAKLLNHLGHSHSILLTDKKK